MNVMLDLFGANPTPVRRLPCDRGDRPGERASRAALDGIAHRVELAGRLSNQPAHLIRWIRFPQSINPGGGMPDLGLSEGEARDIAAYLYTLKVHSFAR